MRLLRAAQKAIMMLEKKIQMLENELTSYRGGQKPIAIKDAKGSKRRLTTGNIGRTLKGSGDKTNGLPGNLGSIKDSEGEDDSYSSDDSEEEETAGPPASSAEMEELRDEILAVKEQLKHYQDLTSELQLERANMMGEHEALKSKLNESNNVLENLNEKENALSKELKELSDKNTELENDKILLQRKFENTKKAI